MKPNRAAIALIIRGDCRVLGLFNKRHNGWTLPGGRVDVGQTPLGQLKADLLDQTGLGIDSAVLAYVAPVVPPVHPDRGARVHVYRVAPQSIEVNVHEQLEWLELDEFVDLSAFPEFFRRMFAAGVRRAPTTALGTPERKRIQSSKLSTIPATDGSAEKTP